MYWSIPLYRIEITWVHDTKFPASVVTVPSTAPGNSYGQRHMRPAIWRTSFSTQTFFLSSDAVVEETSFSHATFSKDALTSRKWNYSRTQRNGTYVRTMSWCVIVVTVYSGRKQPTLVKLFSALHSRIKKFTWIKLVIFWSWPSLKHKILCWVLCSIWRHRTRHSRQSVSDDVILTHRQFAQLVHLISAPWPTGITSHCASCSIPIKFTSWFE